MTADEALRWTLAVLLLAATVYSAVKSLHGAEPADRVGSALHAIMTAAMAAMQVPGSQWPVLPQLLLFAVGAWWFILQAVRLRTRSRGRWPMAGKGKPLYDAAAMAAMAFMLAARDLWEPTAAGALRPASVPLTAAPHHGSAAAVPVPVWSTPTVLVLAVVFSLATVLWAARLILQLWPGSEGPPAPGALDSRREGPGARQSGGVRAVADTAVEMVGAAALAFMFAAQAA